YGPKGRGVELESPRVLRMMMPRTAPTREDSRMVSGSTCQPPQAPSMASSLKSPKPMPSLPVISLNSQYTDHRLRYPNTAPHSAEWISVNSPVLLMINPSHNI